MTANHLQQAPGTAGLYEMIQALQTAVDGLVAHRAKMMERRRAIWLCFVDEDEQALGYGRPGKHPRTAQIRRHWKELGMPDVGQDAE